MLKKEQEILILFARAPWKKYTLREIKALARKKSESYVYNTLKRFVKEGVLREEKAGNVTLYALNAGSLKARAYAGFAAEYEAWRKKHIPFQDMEVLSHKIPAGFFVLMITGSYAVEKQQPTSDIDAIVICEDCVEPNRIYAELRYYCEMSIPQIHLYAFRKSEFLAMLLDKKANYGKEAARKNLILFGAEAYYKIIDEAMKNGYNG